MSSCLKNNCTWGGGGLHLYYARTDFFLIIIPYIIKHDNFIYDNYIVLDI